MSEKLKTAALVNAFGKSCSGTIEQSFAARSALDAHLSALLAERDGLAGSLHTAIKSIYTLQVALECAIQAAFDGPAEAVGSNCAESYREWRTRMEKTARAALNP